MRRPLLLLALLVAACHGTAPTPVKTPKPNPTVAAAATSPAPRPSPASAAPSSAPTATATPTAKPTPSLLDTVARKLLPIAQVGFMQGRGQLISDHGAGLLSDAGAAVISNNAGSLIANNSGTIISDHGNGYRLAALPHEIDVDARPGETLVWQNDWVDGTSNRYFRPTGGKALYTDRRVDFNAKQLPVYQEERLESSPRPGGPARHITQSVTAHLDDGRFGIAVRLAADLDENLRNVFGQVAPGDGEAQDSKAGLALTIDDLTLDFTAGKGTYTFRYPGLGLVEKGTFEGLVAPAFGQFEVTLLEPHRHTDGDARVEDAQGKLLFVSKTRTAGSQRTRDFDLQDGLSVHVVLGGASDTGQLLVDGKEAGSVTIERRGDATQVFHVTLPDAQPLVIGYGVGGPETAPATPEPSPRWQVATLDAGARTFTSLQGLVASRVTPGRFYLVDFEQHELLRLDVGAAGKPSFTRIVGGSRGITDGPAASAMLDTPIGLAVAADDTLYVAEATRIRRVAPDGTVSTIAGTLQQGSADGPGATASFGRPAGLALDAKGLLYVADFAASTIRTVDTADPAHPVTTLAGAAGQAGLVDGAAADARFQGPAALALDATGRLLIADELNLVVRRYAAGQVSTVAGDPKATSGNFDGPALQTGLYRPRALTFGPDGLLYIASSNVRRLDADGKLRSYAGVHEPADLDGNHDGAQFVNIRGLAFGPGGLLYVADGKHVRTISPP